jgi:RNA-directed DNA polymerase
MVDGPISSGFTSYSISGDPAFRAELAHRRRGHELATLDRGEVDVSSGSTTTASGLELHPEKTRLIEFGRFAAQTRERRGDRKPETFDFLGLTHICAKDRRGRFKLKRITSQKKMQAKLKSVKTEMRRRMHLPIPEQGRWLASVLQGHFNYYGVPDNSKALQDFRDQVVRHWRHALARRSQKGRITWERMRRLAARWLPRPRILHPWPNVRFDARTQGRSPVR